ncbi:MAG: EF-hand domain-containing protein [Planctomycetota bacterium]
MMMRIPVIAALDADRDGVISSAEIENAAVALKKLDKNNDGKIDAEEMRPQGMAGQDRLQRGRPGTEPQRGRPGMDTERGGRPGAGGDGDAAGRGAAGRGGAMLDRLMQQDKDGDGMLSGSEIPERMAAMMDRADSNSDGKLSREEIETAMKARMGRGGAREGRGPRGGGDTPGGERPRRPPTGEDPAV